MALTVAVAVVIVLLSLLPMLRLIKEKGIEGLDLGFGADALMLSALAAEPLAGRQGELEGDPRLQGARQ